MRMGKLSTRNRQAVSKRLKQPRMEEINEEWRKIKGENFYFVSNTGKVCSTLKGKRNLKPALDNAGYLKVNLGRNRTRNIHRLVAEAFIPNPEEKRDVNHKDGNKLNNNVSNLEWLSHSENIKHSYDFLNRKRNNWTFKPVFCVETGKSFRSIKEASEFYGISEPSISNQLAKRIKTAGGYHWRFL